MNNPNDEYQTHCERCGAELNGNEKLHYGWLCESCDDAEYRKFIAEAQAKKESKKMMPSETCEACGRELSESEQLEFLFMCRECHEEESAYINQLFGLTYEHGCAAD